MDTLKISEVKESLDALFKFIADDLGVKEVPLEKDYYWNVPISQSYRLEAPADEIGKQLDVGSLIADWKNLRGGLNDPESRVAFQLTYAASLLRYLGEAVEAKRLTRE